MVLSTFSKRSDGFSLVEIMVGMTIGMFGLIIMMQVFSIAEEQKRTTTSGGDAQSTGAIALFSLQRDIRQAGFGNSDLKIIGCDLTLRSGVTLAAMAPLTINPASIPAGDANTDTFLVTYSNTNGSPQGDIISAVAADNMSYTVATPTAFISNDRVIAAPRTRGVTCALTLDTVASNPTGNVVSVVTGAAGMVGGTLFNLGNEATVGSAPYALKIYAYAIRSGKLTQCNYMASNCADAASVVNSAVWVQIADGIPSMRLQYGRDTASGTMDGFVDVFDQTAPATACTFSRVSAARIALVARSAQLERTAVTAVAPTWEGTTVQITTVPTNPVSLPIILSGNSNWQLHRYKVFQTVVPIRNLAWAGVQTGC